MASGSSYIISGIQQIGIGVPSVETAWAWYRKQFGMDVPVFQEAAEAPLMTRYTGDKVQSRTATLALNLKGGGGMEIWQYTSRNTEPPAFTVELGDYGFFTTRIKTRDVEGTYAAYKRANLDLLSDIVRDPTGNKHFFVKDLYGLIFQVVEGSGWFSDTKSLTGGPSGCMIGVSDINKARKLYTDVLGYDTVLYDETGAFQDMANLPGGGSNRVRRVLLGHSEQRKGPFSRLLGPTHLELVQALDRTPRRIFENRFWGDLGFIHLCFDIVGMDALEQRCAEAGFPFTIDSKNSFDMGEAAGRFSYIEDPDGTLIEFVETHKLPVLKKIGWYLNLQKRPPEKPLPNWMLKAMGLNRVKD